MRPFATAQRRSNLYGTERWRQESKAFLQSRACIECGKPATVTDHEPPHRGNEAMFWDKGTWQPRCKRCHDSKTAREINKRMDRRRQPEVHPGLMR